jgi:hypothetical protein
VGLKLFWNKQEMLKSAKIKGRIPESVNITGCVWLDDCASDKHLHTSRELHQAAMEGRHVDLCCGVNTQNVRSVPPSVRNNADIVVIFAQFNFVQLGVIIEEWLGMLNKRTALELIGMYTRMADGHGCLVLEPWRNTLEPTELIHWYVAKEPPKFTVKPRLDQNRVEKWLHEHEMNLDGILDIDDKAGAHI